MPPANGARISNREIFEELRTVHSKVDSLGQSVTALQESGARDHDKLEALDRRVDILLTKASAYATVAGGMVAGAVKLLIH